MDGMELCELPGSGSTLPSARDLGSHSCYTDACTQMGQSPINLAAEGTTGNIT